jgi:hypothetical protein
VGGITLSRDFWRRFAEIENVLAIKIAPFNRYRTLDVLHGIVAAKAEDRVTAYTGNDDHIVLDLLTPFLIREADREVVMRVKGGLLGHWCVWTRSAVELMGRIRKAIASGHFDRQLLALDSMVTDCNAAFFDVANDYQGCIAGCHEVLRRQGLLRNNHCLDPDEVMGPGQSQEIDRVMASYPEFRDDDFVVRNLDRWLA